jgi:hypothetical protein
MEDTVPQVLWVKRETKEEMAMMDSQEDLD